MPMAIMTLSIIILPPKIETTDFSTNDFGHAHTLFYFILQNISL